MKINGIILESLSITKGNMREVLLFDNNNYYLLDGFELSKSYIKKNSVYSTTMLLDGMWISDKSRNTTEYIDIFNVGNSYTSIPYTVADISSRDNVIVFSTNGIGKRMLVSLGLDNKNIAEKEFYKGLKFSLDNGFIFTRSEYNALIECYTYKLDNVWQWHTDKEFYGDFETKPQLHNNLLIINHSYDTIALNKKTGEEVWRHTFDDIPTSNVLMQGRIYAVCQAVLYVINPDTGEVELTNETGYPAMIHYDDNSRDEINQIGVFPVGDYLYGIAKYDENNEWLRLYNHDASEVLDKKTIPDYCLNRYGSIIPTIHNGRIFQEVRNVYAYSQSGMMVLEITDDKNAAIKVAPRPAVTMLATPALNVPHKQQIYLDVNNLDDALRYGELYVSELLFATGYNGVYNIRENARDRLHTGELELIIDDSDFDDNETDEYLDELVKRINKSIENAICKAGDKKTDIEFSLVRQTKSEWVMSGEELDWPTIRDRETPIS